MNHYFNEHLAQASVDLTLNDQGHAYIYQMDRGTGYMRGREYKMAHGADNLLPDYKLEFNELGHVVSVTPETELKHYGVKGMRWGVTTKDRATQRTPTPVAVTQKKPGSFAKTAGGKNLPAHEDAIKSLVARQKAKSSTTDALSNQELRAAVERMQLEQKYAQLSYANDRRSKGARFVAGLLGQRKDLKFKDMDEEAGENTRKAVQKALEERAKAQAASA